MRKKLGIYGILAFFLYVLFYYWYLFYFAEKSLPFEYQGTSADPTTFLSDRELLLSGEYSDIRNFLFFISTPVEWLFYLLLIVIGLSNVFKKWSDQTAKYTWLKQAIYLIWLSVAAFVATTPLSYVSYYYSKKYLISTQSFQSWMKDELIDFWINYGTLFVIVTVLYWLMKKSQKRWWFYAWLLSVPFSLFVMFLQPVVIDPLYNDFTPLKNKELETKILALADEAGIPADHVFEVNMAEKTNALNAYVTGIGSNSRIVLWDTTLNRLSDDQILFIMAHEMAHYVEKHLYFGIAGYLFLSLVGLYLIYRLMNVIVGRYGEGLSIPAVHDIRSLPLFLLLLSFLSYVASPVSNIVSRYQESRADHYAMEMTEDADAAISTFQELTKAGLSEVDPPLLVKIFRYGHPTMLERISRVEEYELEEQTDNE